MGPRGIAGGNAGDQKGADERASNPSRAITCRSHGFPQSVPRPALRATPRTVRPRPACPQPDPTPTTNTTRKNNSFINCSFCVACSASKGFPRVPCRACAHPLTLPGPPRPPPLTPRSPLPRIAALLHPSLTPWGHHEAYFSAQQPEPQAHSRFSCSHGDQERPQGDQPPSRQGPQAAGSLSQSLPAFPTRFPCRTSAFRATTAC